MASLLSRNCCRAVLRTNPGFTKNTLACKPATWQVKHFSSQNTTSTATNKNANNTHTHQHHHHHHEHGKPMPLQCWSCTKFVDKEELFCKACNVIQQPEEQEDLFRLFKIPREFDLDLSHLTDRFKKLQRKLHPDLFALKSETEKGFSENQSSYLNHAYNVLKTPHLRAEYLLGLNGIDVGETMGSVTDAGMLMHIMELREAVDEGSDDELRRLGSENRQNIVSMVSELGQLFSSKDLVKAKSKTIELKYLEKIQEEIVHKLGAHV